jgi:transposase-like protein
VQTCIVHLLRHSLDYATWKERKAVAAALKTIYRAPTVEAARSALDAFAAGDWGRKHPPIVAAWRRQWEQVIPLVAHPPEIRRLLYTTNAIESLHRQLRKILKTRGHFPSDEAATKLLYLALRTIVRRWKAAPRDWKAAMNQLAILYPDRFTVAG